jgi:predicted AlkP superfamily phosphohydrolase/phosphomutase
MTAKSKLVIIGVDSADRHLIQEWASEGSLPTFKKLMETSAWGDSANATGVVAGTVWPLFYTSAMPGRTGRFRGTTQFMSGTYQHADIDFDRFYYPPFWDVLARYGKKSLVIDAPYAFLSKEKNVTQLVDWCSHSPWKDGVSISSPEKLTSDVRGKYGRDPIGKCDFAVLDNARDFEVFRDGLIKRIEQKTQMTLDSISEMHTDMLLNVYSECHCAGHQLWHIHDPEHPAHDPELLQSLGGDPMKQVYEALDGAIASILKSVDEDTTVMVYCSHGIGPAYTGTHLLDEILMRIENKPSPHKRQRLASTMVAIWSKMPQFIRTAFTPMQKALWPKLKSQLVQPNKANRKYFEIIINDASGGIRLNVKGREPNGIVDPGKEYDEICEMLTEKLFEIQNCTTGKPLIKRVLKARDVFPGENTDSLPDLMVEWGREGPIDEAYSETIGRVSQKFVFANHRTGDHTEDDGLFFVMGAGIQSGHIGKHPVADLAPTITAILNCEFPNVDGKPIDRVVGSNDAAENTVAGDFAAA